MCIQAEKKVKQDGAKLYCTHFDWHGFCRQLQSFPQCSLHCIHTLVFCTRHFNV